jgi:hypothetical protein
MNLYTVYTESHKIFFEDVFIKTLPFDSRIELRALMKEQTCNAEFRSKGWKETMYYKVRCFIQAAYEIEDGEYFIFSDPDIQFFRPFYNDVLKEVEGYDAAFQNDYGGGVNTGFFIMKSTSQTRAFLKTVEGNLDKFPEEQVCFNYLMRNFSQYPKISFRWKMLPRRYWTYGEKAIKPKPTGEPYSIWEGTDYDFDIPSDIVMHHANWTNTFANKIKLIDVVKQKYNELNKI